MRYVPDRNGEYQRRHSVPQDSEELRIIIIPDREKAHGIRKKGRICGRNLPV